MEKLAPLRSELASVCLHLVQKRAPLTVPTTPRAGILSQLGNGRGLQ